MTGATAVSADQASVMINHHGSLARGRRLSNLNKNKNKNGKLD
jgi:hypothetical protein